MQPLAHLLIDGQLGPLSNECANYGIFSLQSLLEWVEQLPYGRNSHHNHSLVLAEEKGTCSTKNALIKAVAHEQGWHNVHLFIGFFLMDAEFDSRLKPILQKNELAFIPEAHCFLEINEQFVDVSGLNEKRKKIDFKFLKTIEINADQINSFKQDLHKKFIKKYATQLAVDLNQIWTIRETCIEAFSK